ncbi:MAG: sulfate adenylyltransferase, partial [Planctomycetes bacterium]|nr:sulfate adenylyltransferase [Planctomycetota bacterium]
MALTTAPRLSYVHGGLDQPVYRFDHSAAARTDLESITVQAVHRTILYRIADGTLSPLTGPMGISDCESVLDRKTIERDGVQWAWTIPIILPVTDGEAQNCTPGATVLLKDEQGEPFGTLMVSSCFDWDKPRFLAAVYGTERTDHEGARRFLADTPTHLVGGNIQLIPTLDNRVFADRIMGPSQTRKMIEDNGWEQTVAMQVDRPMQRSHEYSLV